MKHQLARQESVLPPGYRLQVIKNAEGFLETVPLGTNAYVSYTGGMGFRNKLAEELRQLFCDTYGFNPYSKEVLTICADVEGNECVWCKARIHPKVKPDRMIHEPDEKLNLPSSNDVIDV